MRLKVSATCLLCKLKDLTSSPRAYTKNKGRFLTDNSITILTRMHTYICTHKFPFGKGKINGMNTNPSRATPEHKHSMLSVCVALKMSYPQICFCRCRVYSFTYLLWERERGKETTQAYSIYTLCIY